MFSESSVMDAIHRASSVFEIEIERRPATNISCIQGRCTHPLHLKNFGNKTYTQTIIITYRLNRKKIVHLPFHYPISSNNTGGFIREDYSQLNALFNDNIIDPLDLDEIII